MPGHDIIVMGASAGGVEVLRQIVRHLPAGLPASVIVVTHLPPKGISVLPEVLSRSGPLLASHACDGEPIHLGQIYVAPPDHHLMLEPGRMTVTRGPRENRLRPAIDPLFRSAARAYGKRVVGVILSGALHDGVAGLLAVRAAGGVAVVQDPADAWMETLPRHASDIAGADHIVPAAAVPALLIDLVGKPGLLGGESAMIDPLDNMPQRVLRDMTAQEEGDRQGKLSVFTCPECGGCLWQVDESSVTRFRCHVGHAYHAEKLMEEQSQALEAALWTAVRTFREKGVLARQLASQQRAKGNRASAERFDEEALMADRYGALIRQCLLPSADVPPTAE